MGLTFQTISWVRSGEVVVVYPFCDQTNRLYILVSSISSVMQHQRNNVECTPIADDCIDSTHISREGSKKNDNKGKGPTPSTALSHFNPFPCTATNQIWLESKST